MTALRSAYSNLAVHRVGDAAAASGPVIVLCSDESYAFQARVALGSIFLNSPSRSLDIVVFGIDWQEGTVAAFDRLARRFGRGLTVVRAGEGILPASLTNPRYPRAAFFRLIVPEILDVERFLYLDCDVVAQIDLDEIWREYREDMLVGGVASPSGRDWKRRRGSPEPDIYVNTGVLLVNAARWRQEGALQRCAEWVAAYPLRAPLADQDAINNALAGSVYVIPGRWNVLRSNQPPDWRLDPDSFRGIYHFTQAPAKPWMRWAEPALRDFYLHYARVVGLPADYWVDASRARQVLAEARWAEQQGDVAKAAGLYKRVAEAVLAKLKEASPDAVVELR